jgi:tetratricopeptide (TPR) repeat protein
MRKLLSVSMPRAGHHVTEMVLGRLFGSRFRYCEYYTPPDCCKSLPCTRMPSADAAGALVFMQKSHDHALSDPVTGAFDGYVIQVREPINRVLSNYELELKTSGIEHSRSYQQFWLGLEAYYTVGFIKKWGNRTDVNSLVLGYEELLQDPIAYYQKIFDVFELPGEFFNHDLIWKAHAISSGHKGPFKARTTESSVHFDTGNLAAFGQIVAPTAATLGYSLPERLDGGEMARQVELVFRTMVRMSEGDLRGALDHIEECLREPLAHPFLLRFRGGILSTFGATREAEKDLLSVIQLEPKHPDAYLQYARLLESQGADRTTINDVLCACLKHVSDKTRSAELICTDFGDTDAATEARAHLSKRGVTREDVIKAFKILLGRDPEDDHVVASHQNVGSIEQLREILLGSPEFAQKYRELTHREEGLNRICPSGRESQISRQFAHRRVS